MGAAVQVGLGGILGAARLGAPPLVEVPPLVGGRSGVAAEADAEAARKPNRKRAKGGRAKTVVIGS